MEERVDRLALPEQHFARGRLDRGGRRGVLGPDAAVDLAADVGVEVEALAAEAVRQRIRAGRDSLRLQRLYGPGARHLLRDDAREVLLESEAVDHTQLLTGDADLDLAPVGTVTVERERRAAGKEEDRPDQLGRHAVDGDAQLGPQDDVAGRERIGLAQQVTNPERHRRAHGHARPGLGDEHAHARDGCWPELGAGVEVGEDLVVGPAVVRVAEGAVLAHADAVSPAAAAGDERRHGHGCQGAEQARAGPPARKPRG